MGYVYNEEYYMDGTGPYLDAKVAQVRYNALRNWYFLNPVNQRRRPLGTASRVYSSNADPWIVDGWKVTSGNAYLSSSGIVLNGTMKQTLEFPLTGTVKGSVLTTSGGITPTYSNGVFSITASNKTLVAAMLEPGGTQTLYRGSTLIVPAPDFQQELARCQRYYEDRIWFIVRADPGGVFIGTIPFKVTKRTDDRVVTVYSKDGTQGKVSIYANSTFSEVSANVHANELPNGGAYGARITVTTSAYAIVMGYLTVNAEP